MNIIDGMKSGQTFSRINSKGLHIQCSAFEIENTYFLTAEDIVAQNWEVIEEKIELTKSQFRKVWSETEKYPQWEDVWNALASKQDEADEDIKIDPLTGRTIHKVSENFFSRLKK